MKLAALALGGLAALASMQASATDDYSRTISLIGLSGSTLYVQFAEGFSAPCKYNGLYIGTVDTAQTKAYLAMFLAARATGGGKIWHVGYTVGSDGLCTPTQVEVSP